MRHLLILPVLAMSLLWVACGGGGDSTPAEKPAPTEEAAPVETPASSVDPTVTGSVAGVVNFEGAAPESDALDLGADAWCKNHHDAPPKEESLLVVDGKVANVFVWISGGLEGVDFPPAEEKVVLDQEGCIFTPRLVGIQLGQQVTMHNGDPVLHNVHTKPELNRQRNVALPTKGQEREFNFDKAEVMIPVVCDVHPWMRAFIGIVDHPFFTVTDATGSFRLDNVPAGELTLQFWHEKLGVKEQKITVSEGGTVQLDDVVMALP